jgi:hypothetical protein
MWKPKMEAQISSETLGNHFLSDTLCQIPEDLNIHQNNCKNITSLKQCFLFPFLFVYDKLYMKYLMKPLRSQTDG